MSFAIGWAGFHEVEHGLSSRGFGELKMGCRPEDSRSRRWVTIGWSLQWGRFWRVTYREIVVGFESSPEL